MGKMLQVPDSKLHLIPLGIDVSDFTRSESLKEKTHHEFVIGYLARMAPEKGLHRLVDAFIAIASLPGFEHVRLKMAGWMGPQHSDFWAQQQKKLSDAGLDNRYEYSGIIDRGEKAAFLRSIDLFSVPTTYEEPKGLFLLEAVAAGVPYLQPDHGAFPELHKRLQLYGGANQSELFRADSQDDLNEKLKQMIASLPDSEATTEGLLNELDIKKHAQRLERLLAPASPT
jgi:glycosyltransferase involved in cell wall biosynthesis